MPRTAQKISQDSAFLAFAQSFAKVEYAVLAFVASATFRTGIGYVVRYDFPASVLPIVEALIKLGYLERDAEGEITLSAQGVDAAARVASV